MVLLGTYYDNKFNEYVSRLESDIQARRRDICFLFVKIEFAKFQLKMAGNIFNGSKIELFTLDRCKLSGKETDRYFMRANVCEKREK